MFSWVQVMPSDMQLCLKADSSIFVVDTPQQKEMVEAMECIICQQMVPEYPYEGSHCEKIFCGDCKAKNTSGRCPYCRGAKCSPEKKKNLAITVACLPWQCSKCDVEEKQRGHGVRAYHEHFSKCTGALRAALVEATKETLQQSNRMRTLEAAKDKLLERLQLEKLQFEQHMSGMRAELTAAKEAMRTIVDTHTVMMQQIKDRNDAAKEAMRTIVHNQSITIANKNIEIEELQKARDGLPATSRAPASASQRMRPSSKPTTTDDRPYKVARR